MRWKKFDRENWDFAGNIWAYFFLAYDYGSFVCSASSLIGMGCAVALYFLEPKLQNPSEVYRKYYVVKVAMRKKARTLKSVGKRHSITVGEVPYLREYIEQAKVRILLQSFGNSIVRFFRTLPKSLIVPRGATDMMLDFVDCVLGSNLNFRTNFPSFFLEEDF